ncbi:MAG: phosphatase PAP2 family protein [Candidatus Helarchaeota archaeon]
MLDEPKSFEIKILFKINRVKSKPLDIFFRVIGFFGTLFFWFLAVGFFVLIGVQTPNILIRMGFGLDPFFLSFSLGIGLGIDLLLTNFLQFLFKRKRPHEKFDLNNNQITIRRWEFTPSFPSAHMHRAFFAVTILIYGGLEWAYFLFILSTIVGISRLYLGAHYPLDVIFGAIFGILNASIYSLLTLPFTKWGGTTIALIITSLDFTIILLGSIIGLIVMWTGFYFWLKIRKKYKNDMKRKLGLI